MSSTATLATAFSEPTGQGWAQIGELGVALVLSSVVGIERELRGKAAGLRTHTIIGFAAALIVLISKYGFTDVLGPQVLLDPSRVAAQIVSGIGFIGAGLIFVRRDSVRGLTTAASVWLTTAIGMAAGSGLVVLAAVTAAGYFVVVFGMSPLARALSGRSRRDHLVQITYLDGKGILRRILHACTARGWAIGQVSTRPVGAPAVGYEIGRGHARSDAAAQVEVPSRPLVTVVLGLAGRQPHAQLMEALGELDGVVAVDIPDTDDDE